MPRTTCSSAPSRSTTANAAPAPGSSTVTTMAILCLKPRSCGPATTLRALTMRCCAHAPKRKAMPAPTTEELLARLMARDAQRTEQEALGQICWLRLSFQNPAVTVSLSNKGLKAKTSQGLQADLMMNVPADVAALPERVRPVPQVLGRCRRCASAGPWARGRRLALPPMTAQPTLSPTEDPIFSACAARSWTCCGGCP